MITSWGRAATDPSAAYRSKQGIRGCARVALSCQKDIVHNDGGAVPPVPCVRPLRWGCLQPDPLLREVCTGADDTSGVLPCRSSRCTASRATARGRRLLVLQAGNTSKRERKRAVSGIATRDRCRLLGEMAGEVVPDPRQTLPSVCAVVRYAHE